MPTFDPTHPAIDATRVASTLPAHLRPLAAKYQKAMIQFNNLKAKMPQPSLFQGALDIVRRLSPVASNVQSYLQKKAGLPTSLDDNSLDHLQRGALYKTIEAARKRTGRDYGTTQYEDYQTTPEVRKQIMAAKRGEINPLIGGVLGAVDPAYDMATTTGRGTFARNPLTGEVLYYDTYDFNNNYTQGKDGKVRPDYMKGRTDFYGTERLRLAQQDDNKAPDNNMVGLHLTPADTIGYSGFLQARGDIAPFQSSPLPLGTLYQKYKDSQKGKQ